MNDYLKNLNQKPDDPIVLELLAQAERFKTPIVKEDAINLIIQMINARQAKQVLEIGSAIGYSAIMMALGTAASITTIERDESSYLLAVDNIRKAGLESRITPILSDALTYQPDEDYHCDLLFIDAAKGAYTTFFERYLPYLNPKGIVVCDNLLFHGLVAEESLCETKNQRKIAEKIRKFNQYLMARTDFDTHVYEIGDGLSISIRKE